MKIKENGTGFITGPYPKTRRRSPEKSTLGRKKPCSRVELLRARQALPLPPLAPPSIPGAIGRSHSGRRGRRCRVRSPDFHTVRWLFGFRVSRHGTARHHPKWNAGGPRVVLAEPIRPAVAGAAVAGGQRFGCFLPSFHRRVSAAVATIIEEGTSSSIGISNPRRRSRPETPSPELLTVRVGSTHAGAVNGYSNFPVLESYQSDFSPR